MVHGGAQMEAEELDEQVKTRIPAAVKQAFAKIAADRHVPAAIVYRDALREYLEKRGMPNGVVDRQLGLPLPNGQTNGESHS